jgi:hypothetical protein
MENESSEVQTEPEREKHASDEKESSKAQIEPEGKHTKP